MNIEHEELKREREYINVRMSGRRKINIFFNFSRGDLESNEKTIIST